MEWLEGEELGARISRGPLEAADPVALSIAVADGLGFLHERGIVHRDLKLLRMRGSGADTFVAESRVYFLRHPLFS